MKARTVIEGNVTTEMLLRNAGYLPRTVGIALGGCGGWIMHNATRNQLASGLTLFRSHFGFQQPGGAAGIG